MIHKRTKTLIFIATASILALAGSFGLLLPAAVNPASPPDSSHAGLPPGGRIGSSGSSNCTPRSDLPVDAIDIPRAIDDFFLYRDGTRVRRFDPLGRAGKVNPDGSVSFPDGTIISHNSATGETSFTRPDGSVTRTNVRTPIVNGENFVWNDGLRIDRTDSSGRPGVINDDGSISYPDGSHVSYDPRTGLVQLLSAEGNASNYRWSGARTDADGDWRWNDGAGAPGEDRGHGAAASDEFGWLRYPDGTLISHHAGLGEYKVVHANGDVSVINGCGEERSIVANNCLGGPAIVDKCMVGTWKLTEGGPMEWLKAQGVPIVTHDDIGSIVMTFNDDGTFISNGFSMNYGLMFRGRRSGKEISAETVGQVRAMSGLWSAKNGQLRGCFTQGGQAHGNTAIETAKGSGNIPFSLGGVGGKAGSSSYSCSTTTFITESPMPIGRNITQKFTRTSQ